MKKKQAPKWATAIVLALVLSPFIAIGSMVTGEDVSRTQASSAPRTAAPVKRPVADIKCIMAHMNRAPHPDPVENFRLSEELCIEEIEDGKR